MSKINPCGNCGSDDTKIVHGEAICNLGKYGKTTVGTTYVRCNNCLKNGYASTERDEEDANRSAISSWNTLNPKKELEAGTIVRVGPWCGRVVDILTSDITREKHVLVKLVKHFDIVTEVRKISEVSIASVEELSHRVNMNIEDKREELMDILDVAD